MFQKYLADNFSKKKTMDVNESLINSLSDHTFTWWMKKKMKKGAPYSISKD